MATHSSILAWKVPWTEEPLGLQSMGSQESDLKRLSADAESGSDLVTKSGSCDPSRLFYPWEFPGKCQLKKDVQLESCE